MLGKNRLLNRHSGVKHDVDVDVLYAPYILPRGKSLMGITGVTDFPVGGALWLWLAARRIFHLRHSSTPRCLAHICNTAISLF
jgi:hypothetical protein